MMAQLSTVPVADDLLGGPLLFPGIAARVLQ